MHCIASLYTDYQLKLDCLIFCSQPKIKISKPFLIYQLTEKASNIKRCRLVLYFFPPLTLMIFRAEQALEKRFLTNHYLFSFIIEIFELMNISYFSEIFNKMKAFLIDKSEKADNFIYRQERNRDYNFKTNC